MDCRKFRDVLDSYLCDELLVETAHEMLRHAEQCPACRSEMAARRSLRERLQRAGAQARLSEDAKERLRQRLREEARRSFKGRSGNGSLLHRIFPPRLPLALARHDALLRAAITAAGGIVFKTLGDGFAAVFTTAAEALTAALAAQRALQRELWDPPQFESGDSGVSKYNRVLRRARSG